MTDNTTYANYEQLSNYSYDCIKYLMNENELIWKLLKYPTPDAWNETDLTFEEKSALIYGGQEDTTDFRVFLDPGQPDAWVHEDTILRIYPYGLVGSNRTYGRCTMIFEVFSHYKINHLSNYKTRVDTITQQLLEVFNGSDIGGIGKLFFDALASRDDRLLVAGQVPFKGKSILMSNFLT